MLAGELKVFTRDSSLPPFNALSYTWGGPVYNSIIKVNGKRLPILTSLQPFLQQAFTPISPLTDTWWWIDSICINQRDREEKASQIPSLKDIFQNAKETVVWLGEASHNSDDAINFLRFLRMVDFWSERRLKRWQVAKIADWTGKYQARWDAVQSLFQRPWWTRVWTVQEQIVPRNSTFLCGQAHINHVDLYWAIRGIYQCHATTGLLDFGSQWDRARLFEFRDSDIVRQPSQSLIATIAYLADHDATDPRDRVFSLSGLTRDFSLCGTPSYGTSVESLYLELVRKFIKEYDSLDIICFATIFRASKDTSSHTLPSWVPDWRVKLTPLVVPVMVSQGAKESIGNLRPYNHFGTSACYSASLDTSPKISFTPDHLKMTCAGILITTIEGLTKLPRALFRDDEKEEKPTSLLITAHHEFSSMDASELVISMVRCFVLNRGDHYLNHTPPLHQYLEQFRTAISEAMENSPSVSPWFADWLQANSDFPFRDARLLSLLDRVIDSDRIRDKSQLIESKGRRTFLARFYDTMIRMERKLVLCNNGKLATVPWRAQESDVICVLYGCSVPVVLREGEEDAYEFIGECYVDGFMEGEAIGQAPERKFVIQ